MSRTINTTPVIILMMLSFVLGLGSYSLIIVPMQLQEVAVKSFDHGRDSVIIEIYPSPKALDDAINNGQYHYDWLTPHMKNLLDSYRNETDKS